MKDVRRLLQKLTTSLAARLPAVTGGPEEEISPSSFTFRLCVKLCLPALIVGAIIRISFLAVTPTAYYGKDSNSYFTTANRLWSEGEFKLPSKRRYLYPLFLAVTPALPGSTATGVAVLQHATGLATVLGIGWIVGHVVRRPRIWVPPVTLLAAAWPRMLWYEHEMIAEVFVLAALVLTVAMALPLTRLRSQSGLLWFLGAAVLIIAFKPHGRPFWLALVGLAAIYSWGRWNLAHALAVAGSLVVLATGGSDSQGSWLLLSSALPLVKTEGKVYQEYRDLLRPFILESRKDFPNYATRQKLFKKDLDGEDPTDPLGPEWAKLCRDRKRYGKVARTLALEGILSQPLTFSGIIYRKVMLALSDSNAGARIRPDQFWQAQIQANNGRWLTRRLPEMRLVFGTDEEGFRRMAADGLQDKLWLASPIDWLDSAVAWTYYEPGTREDDPPRFGLRWIGYLALFGFVSCLFPSRLKRTAIVWFPALFYLGLVYSVGDSVSRYLHPADWCLLVVIALGGDALVDLGQSLFRKWKEHKASLA